MVSWVLKMKCAKKHFAPLFAAELNIYMYMKFHFVYLHFCIWKLFLKIKKIKESIKLLFILHLLITTASQYTSLVYIVASTYLHCICNHELYISINCK